MMRRRVHGKPDPETDLKGRSSPKPRRSSAPPSAASTAVGRASAVAQRAQVDEDEMLQGKFATAQREVIEEEEPLQGRFDVAQRASVEDDEEMVQGKWSAVQRQSVEDDEELQMKRATRPRNATGMPDNLKAGIESLSGVSLDDVRVHYNSPQPAQLDALAYAQGTDIHVGPGQERHLPHEAWHIVQQAQGRVKPTMQLHQGVPVNDDQSLEHEADSMGAKAVAHGASVQLKRSSGSSEAAIVQRVKESFFPDAAEPHVHVHKGGITFTDIGHNHKYLVRGDKALQNNVREVRADLAQRGDERSLQIDQWIANNV
jgi:hypothetical protein